jgi:hypothetical protein
MTTITIERRLLERLYLYWLEDADPRELDEFTAQVRAALSATAPAQPAWHDAPTCEGMWVCLRDSRHKSYRVRDIEVQVTIPEDGDRWYGPIPEDKQ